MKKLKVNKAKLVSLINRVVWKSVGFSFFLIGFSIQGLAQNLQWEKNFGGSNFDEANSIIQTSDGGFAIAGKSFSSDGDVSDNNGSGDYWIIKLDSAGVIHWKNNFGGSDNDGANSIIQTSDGGFAIAGYSESSDGDVSGNNGLEDYWVVKLDNAGELQWESNIGGSSVDQANSIVQTLDGGFVIAGYSMSSDGDVGGNNGNADYWVVKLDNTGGLKWEKNFGDRNKDISRSIVQTSDGGFAIAGCRNCSDGDALINYESYTYWVIKLDSSGSLKWEKKFGGNSKDNARSIVQTLDSGFVLAGESGPAYDYSGRTRKKIRNADYWVLKLDNAGVLEWEKKLGGSKRDVAYSIIQTLDGGFAIAGASNSLDGDVGGNNGNADCWVVKLNNTGGIQWEKKLGGSDGYYRGKSIVQTKGGGFAVAGNSYFENDKVGGNNGGTDYWILKLGSE